MSDHEAILTRAYTEQAALYGDALAFADSMSFALCQENAAEVQAEQLMAKLGEVRDIEARAAAAKAAWLKSSHKPGPELSAALGKVADLLQKLMSRLQQVEESAKNQHKGLIHDLDNLARGTYMRRAYETVRTFATSEGSSAP